MFNIGNYQQLEVVRIRSNGFYLRVPDTDLEVDVLLPGNQAPADTAEGDLLDVFIYRDTKDRLIATTNTPKVTLNRMALLKVVKVEEFGAFLGWGLERDLFLPFSEQLNPVKLGERVLIRLYLDKTERLCATMKTQKNLQIHPPFEIGEKHTSMIYRVNDELGLFVAVEDQYEGLVLKQDIYGRHAVGDRVDLYITNVTADGKLQMTFRQPAYLQMEDDSILILRQLEASDGFLPFNDYSPPEEIKKQFNMSKKAFKRAIGKLYKNQLIVIEEKGIRKK
jgi:hypothetical protein